jgi:hypothetical protein
VVIISAGLHFRKKRPVNWDFFTVTTVISGVILFVGAFWFRNVSTGGRVGISVTGCACIGYGLYVASQDSGFYAFPVQILAIPAVLIVFGFISARERSKKRADPARTNPDAWKDSFNNNATKRPADENPASKPDD